MTVVCGRKPLPRLCQVGATTRWLIRPLVATE